MSFVKGILKADADILTKEAAAVARAYRTALAGPEISVQMANAFVDGLAEAGYKLVPVQPVVSQQQMK
jgi:hypothetical protein